MRTEYPSTTSGPKNRHPNAHTPTSYYRGHMPTMEEEEGPKIGVEGTIRVKRMVLNTMNTLDAIDHPMGGRVFKVITNMITIILRAHLYIHTIGFHLSEMNILENFITHIIHM